MAGAPLCNEPYELQHIAIIAMADSRNRRFIVCVVCLLCEKIISIDKSNKRFGNELQLATNFLLTIHFTILSVVADNALRDA